jgi:hypothetical protein
MSANARRAPAAGLRPFLDYGVALGKDATSLKPATLPGVPNGRAGARPAGQDRRQLTLAGLVRLALPLRLHIYPACVRLRSILETPASRITMASPQRAFASQAT